MAGSTDVVTPAAVAAVQVVAILVGHVVAVVVTHDRLAARRPAGSPAPPLVERVADELPLLLLMVGYTVLELLLLGFG